jgi:hypothetical protein
MTEEPGRYVLNPTDERDRLREECLALVWRLSCQSASIKRLRWARQALQTYAEYKNPPSKLQKPP